MRKPELLEEEGKERGNKWVVYCVVIVGVLIGFGIFVGVICVADVEHYLSSKGGITDVYDTYSKKFGENTTLIYFFGDSTIAYSVYPPLIKQLLAENGYNNITIYNLGVGNEAPLMRALQVQNIIDSKPALVIYGVSYRQISEYEHWVPENIYRVHDMLNVRNDSLYLYSNEELENLEYIPNFYDYKTFLSSALKSKFSVGSTNNGDSWHNADGRYYNLGDKRASMQNGLNEIIHAAKNSRNPFRAEITKDTTRNKEALLYITKTLSDADIKLVFVSVPLNPILSAEITESSRQNLHDFLNSTGTEWIDMEHILDSEYFVDIYHPNEDGMLLYTPYMADLIIQEVNNGVIHNS